MDQLRPQNQSEWNSINYPQIIPDVWKIAKTNPSLLLPEQFDWIMRPIGANPKNLFDLSKSWLQSDSAPENNTSKEEEPKTPPNSISSDVTTKIEKPQACNSNEEIVPAPNEPPGLNLPTQPPCSKHVITYPPGSWSPDNPTGSKVYPREFLKQFQHHGLHEGKGPNITNKAIKRDDHSEYLSHGQKNIMNRGNKKNKKIQKPPVNVNPNIWSRTIAKDTMSSTERNYRSHLNKITAENYDELLKKITKNPVSSLEQLTTLTSLVFEKAEVETKYSKIYANLTKSFEVNLKITIELPEEEGKAKFFRKLVTHTCHTKFRTRYHNPIVIPDNVSPAESIELEIKQNKAYDKVLGLIRYIGELFNVGIVSINAVQETLEQLIERDPESQTLALWEKNLEQYCLLISTTGKLLARREAEKTKGKVIEKTLSAIQLIIQKDEVSSRIRCLLQDVLDMHQNNWDSRKVGSGILNYLDSKNPKVLKKTSVKSAKPPPKVQPPTAPTKSPAKRTSSNMFAALDESQDVGVVAPPAAQTESTEDEYEESMIEFEDSMCFNLVLKCLEGFSEKSQILKIADLFRDCYALSPRHTLIAFQEMVKSEVLRSNIYLGLVNTFNQIKDLKDLYPKLINESVSEIILLCLKANCLNKNTLGCVLKSIPVASQVEFYGTFWKTVKEKSPDQLKELAISTNFALPSPTFLEENNLKDIWPEM